jgi:T5orf172 domain
MVYFLAELREGGSFARIKIGHTNRRPEARMADLGTGNPSLKLMGVILAGTEELERELQRKFSHLCIKRNNGRRSEWFRVDPPELKEFIEASIDKGSWPHICSWPLPVDEPEAEAV